MGELSVLETLQELYITLTALLFDVALCIVVAVQSGGTRGRSRRFLITAVVVTCSVALTCLSFFSHHADVGVPVRLALFFHLAAYGGNIFVTYYLSGYIGSFFGEDAVPGAVRVFNRVLLYLSVLILLGYYILMFPRATSPDAPVFATGWFRALVGYFIELYYMIFCLGFVRKGNVLNLRAKISIVTAFLISVVTFAMQALLGSKPLVNYLGVSIGLLIFYFSAETPDYLRLMETMKELESSREKADAANRSKSDFLANMSHEIRTPINAVLGMNEMILREGEHAGHLTAEAGSADAFRNITTYAANVDSAGKNLLAIINDILDFSKIEAGKMEIMEAPYRLSSVLNDVSNMILFRAKAKNLAFEVEVDELLPDKLSGDEVRVRQVITNLLNNAVKYTDEGTVTLVVGSEKTPQPSSAVIPSSREEGNAAPGRAAQMTTLVVSVRDTGIGIREEDKEKLFTKFERVDLEHNQTVEGTGLGLAITNNLIRLMNGEIGVESNYGEGSCFTVKLPQRVLSTQPIGDFRQRFERSVAAAREYRETFRAPGARVLVVDDTEMNLTVIEGLLKETMVLLELASSGAQALTLTRDTPYDLIFMDQRMPEMSGTEALGHIRAQEEGLNRETPVICLTADAVQGAKDRYLEEGFTDYLSKPVEGESLEQTLLKYLPAEKVVRMVEREDRAPVSPGNAAPAPAPQKEPDGAVSVQGIYNALPALDLREAKRLLITDELIEKTLRQFCENAARNAAEIESYFENEDYENYTIKVHALKSGARMIGAAVLSKDAEHLELCGNAATGEA